MAGFPTVVVEAAFPDAAPRPATENSDTALAQKLASAARLRLAYLRAMGATPEVIAACERPLNEWEPDSMCRWLGILRDFRQAEETAEPIDGADAAAAWYLQWGQRWES